MLLGRNPSGSAVMKLHDIDVSTLVLTLVFRSEPPPYATRAYVYMTASRAPRGMFLCDPFRNPSCKASCELFFAKRKSEIRCGLRLGPILQRSRSADLLLAWPYLLAPTASQETSLPYEDVCCGLNERDLSIRHSKAEHTLILLYHSPKPF